MKVYVLSEINTALPLGIYVDHRMAIRELWERDGVSPSRDHIPETLQVPYNGVTHIVFPMDVLLPTFEVPPPDELKALLSSKRSLDHPQSERERARFMTLGLQKLAMYQEQNPEHRLVKTIRGVLSLLALIH